MRVPTSSTTSTCRRAIDYQTLKEIVKHLILRKPVSSSSPNTNRRPSRRSERSSVSRCASRWQNIGRDRWDGRQSRSTWRSGILLSKNVNGPPTMNGDLKAALMEILLTLRGAPAPPVALSSLAPTSSPSSSIIARSTLGRLRLELPIGPTTPAPDAYPPDAGSVA